MNLFIITGGLCLVVIAVLLVVLRYVTDDDESDELEPKGEIVVLYWPNGTWCYRWELEQMSHMSDDYTEVKVPAFYGYDDIEEEVHRLNGGRK